MKRFTHDQVIAKIRAECARMGSQRAYAEHCGVSLTYLQFILAGTRAPTEVVLGPIGIERVTEYREFSK